MKHYFLRNLIKEGFKLFKTFLLANSKPKEVTFEPQNFYIISFSVIQGNPWVLKNAFFVMRLD